MPSLSLAVEPIRLLELEITPFTPAVPLPQVTAPMAEDHDMLVTT